VEQLIELRYLYGNLLLLRFLIDSLLLHVMSFQPPLPHTDPDHCDQTHANEYRHYDEEDHGDDAEEGVPHLSSLLCGKVYAEGRVGLFE
jgi:hypothetical protein